MEAECNTAYFYALEKANSKAKTSNVLIDENNKRITDQKEIMRMQKRFYQKLYKSNGPCSPFPSNDVRIKIDVESQIKFEEDLKPEEISYALKGMANGKCPGLDGLTVSFYKCFWRILKGPCYEAISEGMKEKCLHRSARRGIINLIPKANRDSRKHAHLRPITILTVDYKLVEKALANRIKTIIHTIVSRDQQGFMANRRISTNIRKILDLMDVANEDNLEAVVLSIDFQKCFDLIEFSAIFNSLEFFGFGDRFISMIKTTYSEFTACVQNNGHFSEYFKVLRGVHQGGPNSSYLFLICAEILAIMLRKEKNIEGIPVDDFIHLLSQYADDMDTAIMAKETCFKELFKVFENFGKISGFAANYDKTMVYRIGKLKKSDARCYTEKLLSWTNGPVNILGVWIDHDIEQTIRLNLDPVLDKIKTILRQWAKRRLSLFGKIEIVNTLVVSQLMHKLMVLPSPTTKWFKKVEEVIRQFIWNNKKARIAVEILYMDKKLGGAGLINIILSDKALKISWIGILKSDPKMANLAYRQIGSPLKENIWKCNLSCEDAGKVTKSAFWKMVLESWCKLNFDKDPADPQNQMIWLNSLIRIEEKPFVYLTAVKKGLMFVGQQRIPNFSGFSI